jgi:hypothetical protein
MIPQQKKLTTHAHPVHSVQRAKGTLPGVVSCQSMVGGEFMTISLKSLHALQSLVTVNFLNLLVRSSSASTHMHVMAKRIQANLSKSEVKIQVQKIITKHVTGKMDTVTEQAVGKITTNGVVSVEPVVQVLNARDPVPNVKHVLIKQQIVHCLLLDFSY